MENEYTSSLSSKILNLVVSAVFMGLAIFVFARLGYQQDFLSLPFVACLLFMTGAVVLAIYTLNRRVSIYTDSIVVVNFFKQKQLGFSSIKGYRLTDKVLRIDPLSDSDSKIIINNYDSLSNSSELIVWVKEKFKDLDAVDLENERKAFLENPEIGNSEEDRADQLKKARIVARAYTVIGLLVGFGFIFVENSRSGAELLIIYPLLSIPVIFFSKGLIKFISNGKRSIISSVMLGAWLPAFILLLKSMDYSIFRFDNLWLPLLGISFLLAILLITLGLNKDSGGIPGQIFLILAISFCYGLGTVRQINCLFDDSELKIYQAAVLQRRAVHGKSTSYYTTLSKWGPQTNVAEVEVSRHLYNSVLVGDTVHVNLMHGKLKAPWFIVSRN